MADSDLKKWVFADAEHRAKTHESRPINYQGLDKELAFHEAGHLVFTALLLKHVNDFTPINYAIICPEKIKPGKFEETKKEGYNRINGGHPDLPEKDLEYKHTTKPFYEKNEYGLLGKLLCDMSGYASYPNFIEDTDFFISNPSEDGNELLYFSIETAPKSISDLASTQDHLSYLKGVKSSSLKENITIVIDELNAAMKVEAINSSIRYVAKRLLDTPCEKLEGEELRHYVREVQRMCHKVDYKQILEDLYRKLTS